MAWARAITELASEMDYDSSISNMVEITLEQIAHKVLKLYWNQTIYFNLIQGANINLTPEIITWTKELIRKYQGEVNNKQPVRYEG
ncbi:hypothetical protein N752_24490 [Desulforamulus aquiferis]|nr:hypothetical protein [Desulforamulus aquiferis]RYD02491.1 hypothetical protein N752_24490 [Desulforamulus aquiferis]